ncbi:hypothetical protein ABIB82_000241 [Bradyrhizobium sp. i1.8.4]
MSSTRGSLTGSLILIVAPQRGSRRNVAVACSVSSPAHAGDPVFQAFVLKLRGCGVLDRPVEPGDDGVGEALPILESDAAPHTQSSSRRRPGPIRRSGSVNGTRRSSIAQQAVFGVMSPGLRRDDTKLVAPLMSHTSAFPRHDLSELALPRRPKQRGAATRSGHRFATACGGRQPVRRRRGALLRSQILRHRGRAPRRQCRRSLPSCRPGEVPPAPDAPPPGASGS